MRSDYRIVVAEDEVTLLPLFQRIIERYEPSARVRTYRSGSDALHSYEQQGADLLIVNYGMPGLDGPVLIRLLRARGDGVPIIATSGDLGNREEQLRAGATVFVETPALLQKLPGLLARFKPS